jgi:hypothetical protein
MRPTQTDFLSSERTHDTFLIQRELGFAIQRSLGLIAHEPLPAAMGLLLMQLALAEVVRSTAAQEWAEEEWRRDGWE